MKKTIQLLFILLFLCGISNNTIAQNWKWAVKAGSNSSYEYVNSVASDLLGNTYITGIYGNNFSIGAFPLTNTNGDDVFIAKYDNLGNVLWANSAVGNGTQKSNSIAVDNAGNCYIAGYYDNKIFFTNIDSLEKTGWGYNIFVVKYNADGDFVWAKEVTGSSNKYGYGIDVDNSGNCYITGHYEGTATFENVTLNTYNHSYIGAYDQEVFLAKYNTDGILQWAKSYGGTNADYGKAIKVDDEGNSFITGFFAQKAYFGSDSIISDENKYNLFLAKISNNGDLQWVKKSGGASNIYPRAIDIDNGGNSYISGFYSDSAVIGSNILRSRGGDEIFIVKFNNLGIVEWAKTGGSIHNDQSRAIAVDDEGFVYITGEYGYLYSNAIFENDTINSNGATDVFLVKYNSNGEVVWANSYGNSNNYDIGKTLAIDGDDNLIIAGEFYGGINFGTNSLVSSGGSDIFVAKLEGDNTSVLQNKTFENIKIYPNPNNGKFAIQDNLNSNNNVIIYNLKGEKIFESNFKNTSTIDISGIVKGMYFVKIINSKNTLTQKIIID